MRAISSSALQQALAFGGDLLQASTRRRTRSMARTANQIWRSWRAAYLPLYAVAGIVGVAVLLLVATAWVRVMLPAIGKTHFRSATEILELIIRYRAF